MDYEALFLKALVLTITVETIALLVLARLVLGRAIPVFRLVFAGILCSAATLPYLWFVLPRFIPDRSVMIVAGEVAVILAEAACYRMVLGVDWKCAALFSVCCNLVSMAAGILVF
jgi:hypothetical protein